MKILLTNDDSHRSPLLEFAISYLSKVGELTVILPAHEQSWKGKAMTCFDNLHLGKEQVFGNEVYTLTGTPADCVNFGVHTLCDTAPDLVVSGINAGRNSGISFLLSSGTVGACLEANIAGIPAIALSQAFDADTQAEYVTHYSIKEETMEHLRSQTEEILSLAFPRLKDAIAKSETPKTWNVNFPFELSGSPELVLCSVGRNFYPSLFEPKTETEFMHNLDIRDMRMDPRSGTDNAVLEMGRGTVSVLDICEIGQVSATEVKQW